MMTKTAMFLSLFAVFTTVVAVRSNILSRVKRNVVPCKCANGAQGLCIYGGSLGGVIAVLDCTKGELCPSPDADGTCAYAGGTVVLPPPPAGTTDCSPYGPQGTLGGAFCFECNGQLQECGYVLPTLTGGPYCNPTGAQCPIPVPQAQPGR